MKQYLILVLCLLFSIQTWGQESVVLSRVTLKTGESYIGEIVVQTADMIMIKTKQDKKYQFQLKEVKSIEKISASDGIQNNSDQMVLDVSTPSGNFSGMLEISGAVSTAKSGFTSSPNMQASLAFGNKQAFGKDLFVGAGTGYNFIADNSNSQTIGLIPVFLRVQKILTQDKTAPFVGFDAGYAFSTNQLYGGGTFVKFSAGIIHQVSFKTALYAGFYAGLNSIYCSNLSEKIDAGTFTYSGTTTMTSLGVKVGLQF
ncbi:MAG: hypothetical protein PHR83_05890 [Paludibacter sp.]|nr:hypothetical protein [Paludibacter sp.]